MNGRLNLYNKATMLYKCYLILSKKYGLTMSSDLQCGMMHIGMYIGRDYIIVLTYNALYDCIIYKILLFNWLLHSIEVSTLK